MTREEILKVLKNASPYELYVVSWENRLVKLKCPFKVRALESIGSLSRGDDVMVNEVRITLDLITVYIIDNNAYFYYHFEITLESQ